MVQFRCSNSPTFCSNIWWNRLYLRQHIGRAKVNSSSCSRETYAVTAVCLCRWNSQETRDVDQMLVQRWADVVDGGSTLNQHWVNVLRFLGCLSYFVAESAVAFFRSQSPQAPNPISSHIYTNSIHGQCLKKSWSLVKQLCLRDTPPPPLLTNSPSLYPEEWPEWKTVLGSTETHFI